MTAQTINDKDLQAINGGGFLAGVCDVTMAMTPGAGAIGAASAISQALGGPTAGGLVEAAATRS